MLAGLGAFMLLLAAIAGLGHYRSECERLEDSCDDVDRQWGGAQYRQDEAEHSRD